MALAQVSRFSLPGVESLLKQDDTAGLIAKFGRPAVTVAIRDVLAQVRADLLANKSNMVPDERCPDPPRRPATAHEATHPLCAASSI